MKNRLIVYLPIVFLLFNSFGLSAQKSDSTNIQMKRSRWSVGIVFSPDYCYRTLKTDFESDAMKQFIQARNDREVAKFGFTAGINVQYTLSNTFSIESGLNYSNKGYALDLTGLTFGDMIDPRFGFVYQSQSAMDPWRWYYHFYYLDVPLMADFVLPGKRIQFITSAGIVANIYLSAEETFVSKDVNGEKVYEHSKLSNDLQTGISASIAAGAIYNFNSKFKLSVMPVFRYSLTPDVRNSSIREHLWSAGMNVGGYYKF